MYPHERSLVKKYANQPFVIIGINSDPDLDKLRPRLEEENITWRSFWNGPEGTGGPISTKWNVSGWPMCYLIDHKGVIRYRGHGFSERNDPLLEELMADAIAAAGK